MDLSDPVDAAALRMYRETRRYVTAFERGEAHPDATGMMEATAAYAQAVDASLTREAKGKNGQAD